MDEMDGMYLIIVDICQIICITICLIITIPLAFFVYFKLCFISPFAENFTFKLIVVNGIASLLTSVFFLFLVEFTTYPLFYGFYVFLTRNDLVTLLSVVNVFFAGMSLNTALFISLNRLKACLFLRLKGNDSIFFSVSIVGSFLLTLPAMLDFCLFTKAELIEIPQYSLFYPKTTSSNTILQNISNIIAFIISLATLLVNMALVVILTRERQFIEKAQRGKFNAERGLVITSVVSYLFYMLYFINSILARYFGVWFSAITQFLFIGLSSITPFWCLILFTPSIRRMALNRKDAVNVSIVQSLARSSEAVSIRHI